MRGASAATPLVSVILPIAGSDYSRITRAIDSICSQTLKDIELICIIDDPENEKLIDIVGAYGTEQNVSIVALNNDKKYGIARSLNRGLSVAKAKYVARMDSDDEAFPVRLKLQYDFMEEHPDVDLLGMQAINVDEYGKVLGTTDKPLSHTAIKEYSRYACPLIHPTWFIKTDVILNMGGYFEISPAQDYHLISRLLKAGFVLMNLNSPGIVYTVNTHSLSRKNVYTTVRVTNLIRSYIRNIQEVDDKIKTIIERNDRSIYFDYLYNVRNYGIDRYKSKVNKLSRLVGAVMIIGSSVFHYSLFIDTFSLMRIQFSRTRFVKK